MVSTGLLILTTPLRAVASQVSLILQLANNHVKKTLYIQLQPITQEISPPTTSILNSPAEKYACSKLISLIYASAYTICSNLDVRVLIDTTFKPLSPVKRATKNQFDVILTNENTKLDVKSFLQTKFLQDTENIPIVRLHTKEINQEELSPNENDWKEYDNVVLGGTFDRLHSGHKILLSEALIRCRKQLTVGVTDESMVKRKVLRELIFPTEKRVKEVEEFLKDVEPSVNYFVTPIPDPFGPSTVDPNLECIVVSEETVKGGEKVNEERFKKGLKLLDIYTVNLVFDSNHGKYEELKISSSTQRMRLLGRRLKNPEPRNGFPKHPYIIGFTGGICSGKTSIAKRLEDLGMAVIHADQLAHKSYLPGTEVYNKIIVEFGQEMIGSDSLINRRKLGELVFSNPDKLTKLNQIVWPTLESMLQHEISRYTTEGKKFIVLEVPVLIESGMTRLVNEVWVSFIPRDEAIKRIQERDNLPEIQAQQRVDSQLSNEERIAAANVVFCTAWDKEFTQQQVEIAWNELNEYLNQGSTSEKGIAYNKL